MYGLKTESKSAFYLIISSIDTLMLPKCSIGIRGTSCTDNRTTNWLTGDKGGLVLFMTTTDEGVGVPFANIRACLDIRSVHLWFASVVHSRLTQSQQSLYIRNWL